MNRITWIAALSCATACLSLEEEIENANNDVETSEVESAIIQGWRGPTLAATVDINGCTGTVLTARWILTAAHCFPTVSSAGTVTVIAADSAGGLTNRLYSGPSVHFRHPNWGGDKATSIDYDLQMVYLSGGSIPSTFPNRGQLFADFSAQPWFGSHRLPAWIEGVGPGSEAGSAGSCEGPRALRRRNQIGLDGSSSTKAISDPDTHCGGDSGGPWMFQLFDGNWKMVQFAVHHGHNWGGICGGNIFNSYDTAATITSGLSWIEGTMRSRTPLTIHYGYASGYAYRSYQETCAANTGATCTKKISCCSIIDGERMCGYVYVNGTVSCSGACVTTESCRERF
jgi:hypothetical protein